MGLETGTYISDLVSTNPLSSDAKSAGDDHIRLIKSTVKATFPNVAGAVTPTHTELNYVDGVTSAIQTQLDAKAPSASPTFTGTVVLPSTTSIGTVSNTEISYLDGVTSALQTQLDAKAPTANPTFTGTVTVPTPSVSGAAATKGYVDGIFVGGTVIDTARTWTTQQTFTELKDTSYNLTGTVIDPANGGVQYKTLSDNTTFTESLEDGQAVLLAIDDGTAYTITWPTTTWVKVGGTASAPTLATSGYTWILLWKLSTTLYGSLVGTP